MPGLDNYAPLFDLYNTTVRYLGRFLVQRQLLAIVLVLAVAAGFAALTVNWAKPRYVRWFWRNRRRIYNSQGDKRWPYRLVRAFAIVLQQLAFPATAITLLLVAAAEFDAFGWLGGLLVWAIPILMLFLVYRLGIAVLYIFVRHQRAERYQRRLFGPLMFVTVVLLVLSRLTDLNQMAQIVLFPLFNNPVTIGALFLATVGLYFWIDATYGIQDIFKGIIVSTTHAHEGTVEASLTILRYLLIGLGVFAAMSALGLNATTVAAITGGLSIGVGFALQDVIKNFFGGLVILFEGTVRPGDYVEVGGKQAVVQKLNIRSTIVRTGDNIEIIVPNQDWLSRSVITYTGTNRSVRLNFPVSVQRSADAGEVYKLLHDTARRHPLVLEDPEPSVSVSSFNGAAVSYVLALWVADADRMGKVNSEIQLMLLHAFENADIALA